MIERRHITVEGIVQGVGFRPFVYGLAIRNRLGGFVLNDTSGVTIELEGEAPALDSFLQNLREEPPPLASIERIVCAVVRPRGERTFNIAESRGARHAHCATSYRRRRPRTIRFCVFAAPGLHRARGGRF